MVLSIIGIAAIAIAIYLLGRAAGKRAAVTEIMEILTEFELIEETSEFVQTQRQNALDQ